MKGFIPIDVLVDTSVLVRLANLADPLSGVAADAVLRLRQRGATLHVAPQCLVEFRTVATRPASANGLGLSVQQSDAQEATVLASFALLPETPAIFPAWRALVAALGVIGKQVHDARLVATCHAHAVPAILTFNVDHFTRLGAASPGVAVVDPASV